MPRGSSTFSVVVIVSLAAMIISSAYTFYLSYRTYVVREVEASRAGEMAIGVMWFAVQAVSANPAISSVTYPGTLRPDQSLSIDIAQNSSGLITITVTSIVTGAQASTRRVVATFSTYDKRVISWSEV